MARIVTTQYRYKRPPKKRKPAAIKVPEVVTVRDRKRVANRRVPDNPEATPQPANDDRKAGIVSAKKPGRPHRSLARPSSPRDRNAADSVRCPI
jgi:hypothetical protein